MSCTALALSSGCLHFATIPTRKCVISGSKGRKRLIHVASSLKLRGSLPDAGYTMEDEVNALRGIIVGVATGATLWVMIIAVMSIL